MICISDIKYAGARSQNSVPAYLMDVYTIIFIEQNIIVSIFFTHFIIMGIIPEKRFPGAPGIIKALFDGAGVLLNICKMPFDIILTHYKTAIADMAQTEART